MERVSIIHGNKPILLIAPHGPEDRNTDTFTASAAKALGCSAVINRGFIKGPRVDVSHDIANCDHVSHCRSPVVYDEFMRPIVRWYNRFSKNHRTLYVFVVHSIDSIVRDLTSRDLSMVIGFGQNFKNPRFSCDPWRKDLLSFLFAKDKNAWGVWVAGDQSPFSGWEPTCLNQLFYGEFQNEEPAVQSMQLSIIENVLWDRDDADISGVYFASILTKIDQYEEWTKPDGFMCRYC